MRSTKKLKQYAKDTLSQHWVGVTVMMWLWEAVFLAPAVMAHLEIQQGRTASLVYLLVVAVAAGPFTYLMYRFFFRMINLGIEHSDNHLLRVAGVYMRSVIGLAAAAVVLVVTTFVIDTAVRWIPVGMKMLDIPLEWPKLALIQSLWTEPLWWPVAVIMSAFVPLCLSQAWLVWIDEPQTSIVDGFKRSWTMMKGRWGDYFNTMTDFNVILIVVIAAAVLLVWYLEGSLKQWLGLDVELWTYAVAIGLAMGPFLAYLYVFLVAYYIDLKVEVGQIQASEDAKTVSEWKEEPRRSTQEIAASLAESIARKQAALASGRPVREAEAVASVPASTAVPEVAPVVSASAQEEEEMTGAPDSVMTVREAAPAESEPILPRAGTSKRETMDEFMS